MRAAFIDDIRSGDDGIWGLVSLILLSGVLGTGCPQTTELPEDRLQPSPPSSPASTPASTDEAGNTKTDKPNETADASTSGESSDETALRVRTVEPQTDLAERALQRNFKGFLERESLGFDQELVNELRRESTQLVRDVQALPNQVRSMRVLEVLRNGLPFVLFALFIALFFVLSRQFGELAH